MSKFNPIQDVIATFIVTAQASARSKNIVKNRKASDNKGNGTNQATQ